MSQIELVKFPSTQFPPKMPIESGRETRLESAGPVTQWNRWSYATDSPLLLLRCDASSRVTTLYSVDGPIQQWDDPLDALRWLATFQTDAPAPGPPFKGGWVGWISYDFGRVFETIPTVARDDLSLPLFEFQYHDRAWALDRATDESFRITASELVKSKPMNPASINLGEPALAGGTLASEITCNFTRATYTRAVQRVIDYIASGDIFQVNLSQRFSAPLQESPHEIYARLQRQSGASFGAYLGYADHAQSAIPQNYFRE